MTKEDISRLNEKWQELASKFYVCYSVKELAYTIAWEIRTTLNTDYCEDNFVDYKYWDGKHKIAFEIENGLYFTFDIYFVCGMFGDCGLNIGNAKTTKDLKGYKDIEIMLEDDFEEV